MKKLIGKTDLEDALKNLDKLTHEEARMAVAQNLKATHNVDERVRGIANTVEAIDNRVAGVDDRVAKVDDRVAGVDERVAGVDERVAGVDGRVAGVDSRVACVDDKVASVDDKVKMVGDKVAEVIHGAQNYLRSTADGILRCRTAQMEGKQIWLCNKLLTM